MTESWIGTISAPVEAVIGSAVLPTLIADTLFLPDHLPGRDNEFEAPGCLAPWIAASTLA